MTHEDDGNTNVARRNPPKGLVNGLEVLKIRG